MDATTDLLFSKQVHSRIQKPWSQSHVCCWQHWGQLDSSEPVQSFQMYSVSLVACVSKLITNACTKSLSKEFMTPGSAPQNVSVPVCRLISSKVISVEWLKPLSNNGRSTEYQLVRYTISNDKMKPNRSETIYIGQNNYYLDTNANDNTIYKYMVSPTFIANE